VFQWPTPLDANNKYLDDSSPGTPLTGHLDLNSNQYLDSPLSLGQQQLQQQPGAGGVMPTLTPAQFVSSAAAAAAQAMEQAPPLVRGYLWLDPSLVRLDPKRVLPLFKQLNNTYLKLVASAETARKAEATYAAAVVNLLARYVLLTNNTFFNIALTEILCQRTRGRSLLAFLKRHIYLRM